MKLKILFFIAIGLLFSCNADECGNSGAVYGKYINHSNPNAIDFILVNKDGTYLQYYKMKGKPEKKNGGKWLPISKGECKIRFRRWKDIVGYIELDEISYNYAHYRNNKLMFFEDIPDAEYEKEEE